MTTPPPHTQTVSKIMVLCGLQSALTQPKFELGICGIIQDVFQGNYTTKQKFEKLVEKN